MGSEPLVIVNGCLAVINVFLATIQAFPGFLQSLNLAGMMAKLRGRNGFILFCILLAFSVVLNVVLIAAHISSQQVQQNNRHDIIPVPTVSAPAIFDPRIEGQLLLDDSLFANTTDGRWQVGTDNTNSSCNFRTGGYEIKATHYSYICKDETDVFANFILQVDISLSRQSEGSVLFRVPETGGGYYFGIDDRGNYEIRKNNPEPPLKQVLHRDIPKSSYELIIVANGSSFNVYVDGRLLDHFDDASYSDGHIALGVGQAAGPINQPNTRVIFTNLKIWQPSLA